MLLAFGAGWAEEMDLGATERTVLGGPAGEVLTQVLGPGQGLVRSGGRRSPILLPLKPVPS